MQSNNALVLLFQYGLNDYKGTVFRGEAPESDDEILAFSSVRLGAAQEVTEVYKPSPKRQAHREPIEGKTVLQKILSKLLLISFIFVYWTSFFSFMFSYILHSWAQSLVLASPESNGAE